MIRWASIIAAIFLLTGCQSGGPALDSNAIVGAPIERIDYRLGAGDQVRVIVFGEETLSGEFVIDGTGAVSLPLIGQVRASGSTLREFERTVEARLSEGYLNDPRVSVEVLNFRPFYILGEVEESGEYPYTEDLTVMNAVATAGGFTYRANTRTVYIKHAGENAEREYPLTSLTPVRPGDTVRIAERYF